MELSATLQAQQRATITEALADIPHQHRFTWLSELPQQFCGLMLGNEVLDAMPVRLIGMDNGQAFERGVAVENHQLIWQERPSDEHLPMPAEWRDALRDSGARYLSETHTQQTAFIESLACVFMTVHSSDVSLPGFRRMWSGIPTLPMSCKGAERCNRSI